MSQQTVFFINKNNFGSIHIKNGDNNYKILTIDTLINTKLPIIKFQNLVTLKSERFNDIIDSINDFGDINIKCESGDIAFTLFNGENKRTITYFDAYKIGESCQVKCKYQDLLLLKNCHKITENLNIYFGIDNIITFKITSKIGNIYIYVQGYYL
ncbi:hypothetical protein QJ854_gp131 [Moumouvirus goulette]|uniref:Uncharacterized protein n=1 Tax=Moumouvirus goulette TaxID=1247379 RepID=M1PNP8_9VIRU|nr:hypothetical protein QJ854_gp131 [Moumouvirus goulette]AGF85651.1 hypothetical protein glt_00846 [Moumouvirus goulette]